MNKKYLSTLGLLCLLTFSPSSAGQYSNNLGNCLVENTTPKENRILMTWILSTLSSHPDVQNSMSYKFDQEKHNKISQKIAELFTTILLERCANEFSLAAIHELDAIETSFERLGEYAMMSLMQNQEVAKQSEVFTQYIDENIDENKMIEFLKKSLVGTN